MSDKFYHEASVALVQRGERPHRGDTVIVVKQGDAREGERAVVVQDDQDTQPYRLRFEDGALSDVFYRERHVRLADEKLIARQALPEPTQPPPAAEPPSKEAAATAGAAEAVEATGNPTSTLPSDEQTSSPAGDEPAPTAASGAGGEEEGHRGAREEAPSVAKATSVEPEARRATQEREDETDAAGASDATEEGLLWPDLAQLHGAVSPLPPVPSCEFQRYDWFKRAMEEPTQAAPSTVTDGGAPSGAHGDRGPPPPAAAQSTTTGLKRALAAEFAGGAGGAIV